MNIMSNCVPNELITCDDRDPPWMNLYIKISLLQKVVFIKDFYLPFSNIKMFKNINMFKNNQLIKSIHTAKQKYFNKISKNLCDPLTTTKCYWS